MCPRMASEAWSVESDIQHTRNTVRPLNISIKHGPSREENHAKDSVKSSGQYIKW